MKWNSLYFFNTVLPFGLRSAPYLFDQFSCMIEWIIKNKLGIPNVIHILDDFFFVTSPPRSDCLTALCKILCLFTELNIPVAPGKTFAPATSLEFMGILLDSTRMEARLPLDKIIRAKRALQQWLHRKSATLKELQSLIGTLQFAYRVVSPGQAFLQRIISLTNCITNSRWHIKLNGEFRKDISMWLTFLTHWNGVSLFLGVAFSPRLTCNYLRTPLGPMGMVAISMGNGFRLLGSLHTSLTPPWVSALTGTNCLQFTSPATSGALCGQANIFVCGATTCQLSPSSTPNAPSPLGSWTSYGPLRFLP